MSEASLLSKALSRDGEQTKEEVSDILFYVKEIFGAVIGIIVAVVGLTGLTGLIAYVLAASALSYVYVYKFLGVDEEAVETKDVLKDHFMNGFFPFLLCWILGYNFINFYN
jgi:hypothetical protein